MMPQVSSLREWYRDSPFAGGTQEDRTLDGGRVTLIHASPPAGAVIEPPVREYALHLLLRTAPLLRVGFNRQPRWLAVSPGSMILAPPDTCCEYLAEAPAHVLTVAVPKECVDEFCRSSGASIEVRREEAFRDPPLERELVRLWQALTADVAGARLYAADVAETLLASLTKRTGTGTAEPAGRERLPAHTLRRVCDYVEERLAEDLDVPMLALVAGSSPAHFARAFTATVGTTPFRFVMMRRLARAREQLERTRRSALDIALDAGFRTPSHFAARFRREFGVTPREVRPRLSRAFVDGKT